MAARPFSLAAACLMPLLPACGDDGGGGAGTQGADTGSDTAADGSPGTGGENGDMGTADPTSAPDDTAADATTGATLDRLEQILEGLNTGMFECPDRAWPGVAANLRASQVLLLDETEDRAYLWNDQTLAADPPELTEVDYASLGPEWRTLFGVGFYNDVLTLSLSLAATEEINQNMSMDGTPPWHDFALDLGFHESMHFLTDQGEWNILPGDRSQPYPEPGAPRYLRAQLGWALRAELEAGTAELGAAAYWRNTVRAEFPDEMAAIAATDIIEGSAEYGSAMMNALTALGCDATDDELIDAAIAHLDNYTSLDRYEGGREPYDLGVVAGLHLQRLQPDTWQGPAESGTTMLSQLLERVTPSPADDDAQRQADAQAAADERNMIAGETIEPMLAEMVDPTFYRLAIPGDWAQGTFMSGGFYYLVDDPNRPDVLLTYSARLVSPGGTEIDVSNHTTMSGAPNPCAAGPGFTFLLPSTAATDNGDGTFTSSDAEVAFANLTATVINDDQMLPWLCPEQLEAPAPEPGLHGRAPFVELPPNLLPLR